MTSGLLSLKWNHHRSTFLQVLANIRQKESYSDVTLACDGKFYASHKLVLSTCSEYFEEMFERTQCKHPVIVLKDIGAEELDSLLSYMYDGEVNVMQENLSSLMKAAECLKIKGLAFDNGDSTVDSLPISSKGNNDVLGNSYSSDNSGSGQYRTSSVNSTNNVSGGVKRPLHSVVAKSEEVPVKRRRPEYRQSVASGHNGRLSSSSAYRTLNESLRGDVGAADPRNSDAEASLDTSGIDLPANDGQEDSRTFVQNVTEQTGVKAEPVEIMDTNDMTGFDTPADRDSHDVSGDTYFIEEKFRADIGDKNGDDADNVGTWSADLYSQPSTSYTGQDGGGSNTDGRCTVTGGSGNNSGSLVVDRWFKSESTTPKESKEYSANQLTTNNEVNDESTAILKEPVKKKARKTRKYDKEYLKFGFSWTGDEKEPIPLCVICFKNLANESMKPSKLKRHFEANHNQYKDQPIDFFENKLKDLNQSKKVLRDLTGGGDQKRLEASYRVSLLIAKCNAAETIGEILIKPAAKIMAEVMIGDQAKQTFDRVPLSNNTVHRRIIDMSNNVKKMLLNDISQSRYYALQVDEFTDVANFANLMAFVRYEKNQEIHDDFLFCQPLLGHTTEEDIFNVMNTFMQENKIDWNRCVGLSTGVAKSMVGINEGLVARIQNVAPNIISTHCCIHKEAMATRKMPADLQKVLDESLKIVNYIKNCPLNALFSETCEEMASSHSQLFHTDVRWLSRRKILSRLFELRHELQCFLNDRFELRNCLHDWKWLCKLAYLADIFSVLNSLNLSLQGKEISVFHVQNKVNTAITKLNLWQKKVDIGEVDSFPSLHEFISSSATQIDADTLKCITQHLESLQVGLKNSFPDLNKNIEWIRYPFNINTTSMPEGLSHAEEEQLLELASDGFLKNKHKECTLTSFWLQIQHVYPVLTQKVLKYILPFPTSYLCEVALSAFVDIKSKKKRTVDVEPHLRLKLTTREPNYDDLSSQHKQFHPSH